MSRLDDFEQSLGDNYVKREYLFSKQELQRLLIAEMLLVKSQREEQIAQALKAEDEKTIQNILAEAFRRIRVAINETTKIYYDSAEGHFFVYEPKN